MRNQDSGRLWKKINCETLNKASKFKPSTKEGEKIKRMEIIRGQ